MASDRYERAFDRNFEFSDEAALGSQRLPTETLRSVLKPCSACEGPRHLGRDQLPHRSLLGLDQKLES